ncbi:MAG: type IV pilin protein [Desulfovibrionales bacterium]
MKENVNHNRWEEGFSLIELLIVVAIIGLLAAVALPLYNMQTMKAQRTDARAALMESAQRMERYFTNHNTYVGASVGNASSDQVISPSEKGFYTLALPAVGATTYTIRATRAKGTDPDCTTMTINQAGQKTPAKCW